MRWLFCTPFLPTCCICSTELPSFIQFIHTRTQAKKPNYQQIPCSKAQVFFLHANKLLFCLSFSVCSSCLQKYSCAFNKEVPVHFAVRCLMGTWRQKINSARHGTDSSTTSSSTKLHWQWDKQTSRCKTQETACSHFPELDVYLGLPY